MAPNSFPNNIYTHKWTFAKKHSRKDMSIKEVQICSLSASLKF